MCLPSTARAERRLRGPPGCCEKPMTPASGQAMQPVPSPRKAAPAQTPWWVCRSCVETPLQRAFTHFCLYFPGHLEYSLLNHPSGVYLDQDTLYPPCGEQDDCALGLRCWERKVWPAPCRLWKAWAIVPHTGPGQGRRGMWWVDKPVPVPAEPTHPASSSGHGHRTPSQFMDLKGLVRDGTGPPGEESMCL